MHRECQGVRRKSLALALVAVVMLASVSLAPAKKREDGKPQDGPPESITFMAYNLRNYLPMDRPVQGRWVDNAPKPEHEIEALLEVILSVRPDVLGICEMGDRKYFDDFRERLKKAGMDYPYINYVKAVDPNRHLALLSMYPIVQHRSKTRVKYRLRRSEQYVSRGFLDVVIEPHKGYQLRCVGVHLKSKRPVPLGQALIRRNEALLLREYIDEIIEEDPKTNILLYGDFNDTRNTAPIEEVMGIAFSETEMIDIRLEDEDGYRWTHYWRPADIYSRIDYIFYNRALMPEIDHKNSGIVKTPNWFVGSDHRALYATIKVAKDYPPPPLKKQRKKK